jgi:hypothetical protein
VKNAYRKNILIGNPDVRISLRILRHTLEDNIRMDGEGVDWDSCG